MKALCIDNFGYHDYIEVGQEYEVLSIEGNQVEIDIDKPFRTFNTNRFKIEGYGVKQCYGCDDEDEEDDE